MLLGDFLFLANVLNSRVRAVHNAYGLDTLPNRRRTHRYTVNQRNPEFSYALCHSSWCRVADLVMTTRKITKNLLDPTNLTKSLSPRTVTWT
jgi:hypothetical protein